MSPENIEEPVMDIKELAASAGESEESASKSVEHVEELIESIG